MGLLVLLMLITVPIAEIALFIRAGELIGLWPTVGLVIATAVAGTALMRHQGLAILAAANAELAAGRMPVASMFDGLCVLIAGALLLTPGFLTDTLGLLLMLPPVRGVLRGWLTRRLEHGGRLHIWRTANTAGAPPRSARPERPPVIEGDYEDLTDDPRPRPTASPWAAAPPDERR